MIKVNLASRKGAAIATSAGGLGGLSANLSLQDAGKELIRPVVLGLLAYFGSNYYFDMQRTELLDNVQKQLATVQARVESLQGAISKFKKYEEMKKVLEADEKLIKNKLDTILRLSADKSQSLKVLETVSQTLPAEVWLSSLRLSGQDVELRGNALDFSQVSDFMKRFSEAETVADVQLVRNDQGRDEKGITVATFEVKARRKN